MRKVTIMLAIFFVILSGIVWHGWANDEILMIIAGEVIDSVTGEPIQGAFVSAPKEDISLVATDEDGNFKFVIPCSEPVMIKVVKEGYQNFSQILVPQSKVELDIYLEKNTNRPGVMMTKFVSRSHIEGSVENISPQEYEQYKVVMYVLTDKWYTHPFAEDAEGQGFAAIKADGTWKIRTVFRGVQAYRVAFLLTAKATYAPATVGVAAADPDGELLSRIETVAYLIIEAPKGI